MSETANLNITVNGRATDCPAGLSVLRYLELAGLNPAVVVVELNGAILTPEDFQDVSLKGRDSLEIIHFVGGG